MSGLKSNFPKRIACLTAEAAEIVFRLGAADRVVGVSGFCVRPEGVREKPKISAFVSARMERIRELNPDLILGFSNLQKDIARDLVAEGYNVFITNQRTLEETIDAMLAIGRLIGCEAEAGKWREEFQCEIETLAGGCRFGKKPRVYFEEWDEPLISGIQWVHELIEKLGGKNVFSGKNSRFSGERTVTPEEVIRANPDIILASWCGKKVQIEKITVRAGWDQIEAVKHGHIYEIKSPDILAPGPSLVHGARKMAEIFKAFAEGHSRAIPLSTGGEKH